MPLFSNESNNKQLSSSQQLQKGFAGLVGMGIGAGAGILASSPVDARYQNKLVAQAKQSNQDKTNAEEIWKILMKLYTGQIDINDLPENERERYLQLLKENEKDLQSLSKNKLHFQNLLKEMQGGKLVPLFKGSEKSTMKGLFMHKVHSPLTPLLPGALGLAGAMGAGYLADKYFSEKNQEESFQ